MKILGIDPGMRRTGLAISDDEFSIAFPLRTLQTRTLGEVVNGVEEAVEQNGATHMGMGLPLDMSGDEGDAALRARRLGDAIASKLGIKVTYWDERLTTAQVTRELRQAKVKGKKIKAQIDESAAALILQSYLDANQAQDIPSMGTSRDMDVDATVRLSEKDSEKRDCD